MKLNALAEFCGGISAEYALGEPMEKHTSFKIGGPADILIYAASVKQLCSVLKKCKELEIPYFILGKGSNLLVSDGGIAGAVISLSKMNEISVTDGGLVCGAGASMSEVCRAALENSLAGVEFAYGIPGSVGGALFMNAGAYGGQMSDVVSSAVCVTPEGETVTVGAEDMNFGYRTSVFKTGGLIVAGAGFTLEKGDKGEIERKMKDYIGRRKSKQPLEYPSAGSFFKRPKGNYAGALIEKNGLKGLKEGGAEVSEKHAGFIVNTGGATCGDVKRLSLRVSDAVFAADGIRLEPEVIFVGRNE